MSDVGPSELLAAVESAHSCHAHLVQVVPVNESFHDQPVWEGTIHVSGLEGHSNATRAYAWSSPIEGGNKRRFHAVVRLGGVRSPVDAIRAAIVAEHCQTRGSKAQLR